MMRPVGFVGQSPALYLPVKAARSYLRSLDNMRYIHVFVHFVHEVVGKTGDVAVCGQPKCGTRAGTPSHGPVPAGSTGDLGTLMAMLNRTDLRGHVPSPAQLRVTLPRAEVDVDVVLHQVRPIVEAVRDRGVPAVLEYAERFDRIKPASVRVPLERVSQALAELDPKVREALEEAIARTRKVHADQRRQDKTTEVVPGGTVTERWVPVGRVGLYAPGGLAVYPSTVVMNVVPAQTAGVGSLVVCSPPQAEHGGLPHPTILAACALLEVEEVWAVGGAQAIALLTYGGVDTDGAELDAVDMITGPGNIYMTAAKRLLR